MTAPSIPFGLWAFAAGGALVLFGTAAFWWRRRARGTDELPEPDQLATSEPAPVLDLVVPANPAPPPPPPPLPPKQPGPRPAIDLQLVIHRAGTTPAGAAVDFEIVLRNEGEVAARNIRLAVRVITASERQDSELAAILSGRPDKPFTPPFELAPGQDAAFQATASLPDERINRLSLGGRPMFVPILALIADYEWADGHSGLAVAYLLGHERPGNSRMAPFWLDTPPMLLTPIGMRQHGEAVRRG